jgi:rhodanese-related sulfurtransferase
MTVTSISPADAKRLLDAGAVLIDIREPDEHARHRIPGARNVALSRLDSAQPGVAAGQAVIFHCKSGMRTLSSSQRLADWAGPLARVHVLDGGLDGWERAGLPTLRDRRQPLELQRQVQIGAGSLALLGTLLGVFLSPVFLVIPAFVGAGLVMAGVTGFCGLAMVLRHMPWNRGMLSGAAESA